MKPVTRWAVIAIAGIVLLLLPTIVRDLRPVNSASPPAITAAGYTPPVVATPALAVTPIPTATPIRREAGAALPAEQLRRGPVVVDLAHYSLIDRAKFQPLAAALAQQGLDLRFWLPTVDTSNIKEITDFPDMSADLAKLLGDSSGFIVISPFFLYTPAEIAVVERFLADGGRLLVISDPDVESDSASDTNQLASAFNVIFNQDYLYDTTANDENFTYFFQGTFLDQAAGLDGSHIAFYGGRSIGGAVETQIRSADTTLSSLRNGLTSFNTVVLGGSPANSSSERVLAMSDFDVLTDPYVARHDNRRMLQFVADFLAGAERDNKIADFPGFLGKEVALAIDSAEPVGALSLATAAELQRVLETSGRHLHLGSADTYTQTVTENGHDLIYVAHYRTADSHSELLSELGIQLVEEVVTPTLSAPAVPFLATAPAATPGPDQGPSSTDGSEPLQPKGTPSAPDLPQPEEPVVTPVVPPEVPPPRLTPEVTPAPTATPTAQPVPAATPPMTVAVTPDTLSLFAQQQTPITDTVDPALTFPAPGGITTDSVPAAETPSPTLAATAEIEPQVRLLLDRGDGLRLLADETLLFIRRTHPSGSYTLAVLGNSEPAINAAMTRLLNRDFSGCLVQSELIICPYSPGTGTAGSAGPPSAATSAATPSGIDGVESVEPTPGPPAAPGNAEADVLVVDDNAMAAPGEPSEAAIYLLVLTETGYQVDNWVTSDQGLPEGEDLIAYEWVIWSDAGYAASGIDGEALRPIGEYINQGGHLTISSRMPFFGVSAKSASVLKDVVVADEIPPLTKGLPTTPILLNNASPVLTPLEENPDPSSGARTALARGPASADAGSPVLLLLSDAGFEEPKGALLMLFGLSMGWLPPDVSEQLIQNMADLMLTN